MNIEDYLAKKEVKHRTVLRLAHNQIMQAHPGICLVHKWGLPVFMLKKNIAYLDVQKDRPLLGVMYTHQIPGMEQLTDIGDRKRIGHFYLDSMNDQKFADLLTVIEIAVTYDLSR